MEGDNYRRDASVQKEFCFVFIWRAVALHGKNQMVTCNAYIPINLNGKDVYVNEVTNNR